MTTNVNSIGIAINMFASDPFPTRGVGKRAAVFVPALASAQVFTVQGFLARLEGPISGISSANANWAPIINVVTGSLVSFTAPQGGGGVVAALAQDVIQAFDAIRLVSNSGLAAAANLLFIAKAG